MGIRAFGKYGVADTEAELLASTVVVNRIIYCIDTVRHFKGSNVLGVNEWTFYTNYGLQEFLISGTNIKTVNGDSLLGSGDLTVSGPYDVVGITTNETIDLTYSNKLGVIDATAGNITITMPSTVASKGKYRFIRIDNSAHTVTFVGALGTERFGGVNYETSLTMKQAEDFDFTTDYTDWFI